MAPASTIDTVAEPVRPKKNSLDLPEPALQRLTKAGIDLSGGYPYRPVAPLYLQEVYKIRGEERHYQDAGARADKSKKNLLSAATKVTDLTTHIGTEIEGIQLKDLTPEQRDELALLIAERSVVFLRDQDLTPQKQKELGEWFGEVEVHPQGPQVPQLPGVTVIWPDLQAQDLGRTSTFRRPGGASQWHTDLVHERQPAGITHLHNDTVPPLGGDTLWASGYGAYEKLSPAFRAFIDGKKAVYRSAHAYLDRENPGAGPKFVEREHPLVRVHPATGWKALWVNRSMTVRIVGLDQAESDLVLGYLLDVYERNVDIQVRFRWTPGTSALWDNRITIHNASWDYGGRHPRHGTRVTSLAEVPYFNPNAPTRRQALGLLDEEEKETLGVNADS
ncbi:uncharacterized protein C8A04DRAFT_34452 [Dichotomopilus funicola]|uniref:TauD/TfdA-like domain-containing protein n=1 Tax=Dichotomopilus funicola TaxID=1934379 RepID=A0AAN6V8Q8_9PEZI|nr:hypothetical protein C8A04DRAFT_34452 [Dichotomopilus funicola]